MKNLALMVSFNTIECLFFTVAYFLKHPVYASHCGCATDNTDIQEIVDDAEDQLFQWNT